MDELLSAIILGIIQGITEWLPISSSGHLVLAKELFGIEQPLIYDIILHLGSLIVVCFVFREKILDLIVGLFKRDKKAIKYIIFLIIGTIPIAIVGLFFSDPIKGAFDNIYLVGGCLLFTSFMLFASRSVDKLHINKKLKYRNVILIGIMQSLAILPGISRSGITITTGIISGARRKEVAEYSFLLFIPAIIGATVLEIGDIGSVDNIQYLLASFFATIITGYFALRLLLDIIKYNKFSYFGWYLLILGLIVLFCSCF